MARTTAKRGGWESEMDWRLALEGLGEHWSGIVHAYGKDEDL